MKNSVLTKCESCAISYIRDFALLLILACHICQSIHLGWEYILNIGVQIFLFISGYLHGRKFIENEIKWYKHKFLNVFVQYYIFVILLLPIYFLFWNNYIHPRDVVIYLADIQWFTGG